MYAIWKFPIKVTVEDTIEVEMPENSKVIHVGIQEGGLCLWAIVDTERSHAPIIKRKFYLRGTGHPLREAVAEKYIATVHDPPFVWHLFDA